MWIDTFLSSRVMTQIGDNQRQGDPNLYHTQVLDTILKQFYEFHMLLYQDPQFLLHLLRHVSSVPNPYPIALRFILILYLQVITDLSSGVLPLNFKAKIPFAFPVSQCPKHHSRLDLFITRTLQDYKVCVSSTGNFSNLLSLHDSQIQ